MTDVIQAAAWVETIAVILCIALTGWGVYEIAVTLYRLGQLTGRHQAFEIVAAMCKAEPDYPRAQALLDALKRLRNEEFRS